jgi:hypothetical protein
VPSDDDFEEPVSPETFDASTGKPVNTPKKRRKQIRLTKLDDIKAEMQRVYRLNRQGEIDPRHASSLIFQLKEIATVTFQLEYKQRIEALERLQGIVSDAPKLIDSKNDP